MNSTSSNLCISLNNHAVALFEKGALSEASKWFKRALDTFALQAPSEVNTFPDAPTRVSQLQKIQIHRWSNSVDILQGFAVDKHAVFLHRRAAYLCPISFRHHLYDNYATFILYNTAICIHIRSLAQKDFHLSESALSKAFTLYSMAFATTRQSKQQEVPLSAILFNNSGQLLYQQGRTFEAAKCFRVVHDLLIALPKGSFEPNDLNNLYLNSLMDSNTASAA